MAEEQEAGSPSGTGPQAGSAGVDPAAVALSLASASREKADAFLEKQTSILDDQHRLNALQIDKLTTQEHFEQSHLRWRRFNDRMKGALQIMTVLVGLSVASAFCVMVWNAAHSAGYVIESFAMPPDLATRGLSGEVVAGRILDRLNALQTEVPFSVGASQALSTSDSDDVRVEIPQTGISLGEVYRFLRRWLGHEIHVSGEVVRPDKNLVVTVRINGRDGALYQGLETDLDGLLQKAAEHIFESVEPARYGVWLTSQTPRRDAEARAVYQRVLADPTASPYLRASAWTGFGTLSRIADDLRQALVFYRRSQLADPTYALAFRNAVGAEFGMSHVEATLAQLPQALAVLENNHDNWSQDAFISSRATLRAWAAELHGDYNSAIVELQPATRGTYQPHGSLVEIALARARLHDGDAPAWLAEHPLPALASNRLKFAQPVQIEAALQHWPQVIALAAEAEKALPQNGSNENGREQFSTVFLRPWLALAKAKTGDLAEAEAIIAKTPGDCYDCVRIRGLVASEAKAWSRADYWFARAAADGPSIPFAHEDWGRSLLDRGKANDAIAQFTLANKKGPKFADPLEGWGEALMAKNQSHLALAKFAEAEKYAPNWGRLHLKWGQALAFSGNKVEAGKHFARAAQLDLTPSEKAELARHP